MPLSRGLPIRAVATGAQFKNRACRIYDKDLTWSSLHGDLDCAESRRAFTLSLSQLLNSDNHAAQVLGHDLHSDYYSTQLAMQVAVESGIPAVAVQHHHAHIATTVAACGIQSAAIGVALDGFGLGTDAESWGGEILLIGGGSAVHQCTRLTHLRPITLPGGDRAARESWRLVAGLLHDWGKGSDIDKRFGDHVGCQAASVIRQMLELPANCPKSSSTGRWFDAAACALGLCLIQRTEAEAAMRLEQCALAYLQHHPDFDYPWQSLDLSPIVAELLTVAPEDETAVSQGAAKFHMALVNGLANAVSQAARNYDINDVAFGGGCFLNSILTTGLQSRLRHMGLRVHVPEPQLLGDAGLALGQAWVASHYVNSRQAVNRTSECLVASTLDNQFRKPEVC